MKLNQRYHSFNHHKKRELSIRCPVWTYLKGLIIDPDLFFLRTFCWVVVNPQWAITSYTANYIFLRRLHLLCGFILDYINICMFLTPKLVNVSHQICWLPYILCFPAKFAYCVPNYLCNLVWFDSQKFCFRAFFEWNFPIIKFSLTYCLDELLILAPCNLLDWLFVCLLVGFD